MARPIFNLSTAWKMFPLVSRIASDVRTNRLTLKSLLKQREHATERKQQWQLDDEIKLTEKNLNENVSELESLSVKSLDPETGKIGFPTMVNNQKAYFTWKIGEMNYS